MVFRGEDERGNEKEKDQGHVSPDRECLSACCMIFCLFSFFFVRCFFLCHKKIL